MSKCDSVNVKSDAVHLTVNAEIGAPPIALVLLQFPNFAHSQFLQFFWNRFWFFMNGPSLHELWTLNNLLKNSSQ